MNRRKFLRRVAVSAALGLGPAYALFEASWIRVTHETIVVPRLPPAFAGLRLALLTDFHHGPFTSLAYIRAAVERTLALRPDVIALGGDYCHRGGKYIAPCFEVLAGLKAPLGVFGVLGNHDHWHGAKETSDAMRIAGIVELTNAGRWLKVGGARLRIAGVDDLWEGKQDPAAALGDTTPTDSAILLSHNPDYAEVLKDRRVGLVLSGHTHGGQVVFPFLGAPMVPSIYGQKYVRGLVRAPVTQVFVSRGLGTVTPPLRFCCRPEINLITFARPEAVG